MLRRLVSTTKGPLRSRLKVAAILAALGGVTLLAAVGSAPGGLKVATADNVTVALGAGFMVTTLDYTRAANHNTQLILSNALEPLTQFSKAGKNVPALAASVQHPNSTTYIYKLRRGVRFWDGAPLTAADVVATLQYEMRPKSGISFFFASVASISAQNQDSVVVKLKSPNATWPDIVSTLPGIQEKAWTDAHPNWGDFGVGLMGTGPYKVTGSSSTGVQMVRNDNWWGGKAPLAKANFTFIADATATALAMRSGEVNITFLDDPVNVKLYKSNSGVSVRSVPGCDIFALALNTHRAPWSNIHVRRAVAYAVDRRAITQAVASGYARPAMNIMPPVYWNDLLSPAESKKLQNSVPNYPLNVTKAKAEMARSSVPKGFSDTAVVQPGSSEEKIAQIVQAELAPLGIKLNIKEVPSAAFVKYYYGPRKDKGIFVQGGSCLFTDPSFIPAYWVASENAVKNLYNQADFRNKKADAALRALISRQSPSSRVKAGQDLLRILQTQLPYVGLYTLDRIAALRAPYKLTFSNWVNNQHWLTDVTTG